MSTTKSFMDDAYVSVYNRDFKDPMPPRGSYGNQAPTSYSRQGAYPTRRMGKAADTYAITTSFNEKHPPWMQVHYGYRNSFHRYLASLDHAPLNVMMQSYPSHLNVAPKSYQWPRDTLTGQILKMNVDQTRPKPFGESERYVNNFYTLEESRRGMADFRLHEGGLRKDRALQKLHESTPLYTLHTKP